MNQLRRRSFSVNARRSGFAGGALGVAATYGAVLAQAKISYGINHTNLRTRRGSSIPGFLPAQVCLSTPRFDETLAGAGCGIPRFEEPRDFDHVSKSPTGTFA